jgi:hypothetical protein
MSLQTQVLTNLSKTCLVPLLYMCFLSSSGSCHALKVTNLAICSLISTHGKRRPCNHKLPLTFESALSFFFHNPSSKIPKIEISKGDGDTRKREERRNKCQAPSCSLFVIGKINRRVYGRKSLMSHISSVSVMLTPD